MFRFFQPFIRMSAFIRKEIAEILRQPRLLFTLVLGPFLILLIFGIGYRNEARALRTLFVAAENSPIRAQIEEYASTLGEQLIYEGVTSNGDEALERLRRGDVDVVVLTPANAYETIRGNQQATFTLYHREIDPYQVDYVKYFGQVYIDEVNRRVLLAITQQGQEDAANVRDDVEAARSNASALRQALEQGDEAAAQQQRGELSGNVNTVSLALGASLGVLSGVQETLGGGDQNEAGDILASLTDVRENTDSLGNSDGAASGDRTEEIARATKVEEDLTRLDEQLNEFTNIEANVLVRPFKSEAISIARVQPLPSDYFAPAVLALLLQHLAVTFAALSIVRERSGGTMELFRVSPLSAGETLLGKYISYMIFGGVIAAILGLLMVYALRVPMLGNWWNLTLVVAALLFTSLGFGFIISLISQTDSQAVQYSMILLLASVFFGGFIMSLDMIWRPVRVVSWSLPATYGTILLRDIMLRGTIPNQFLLGGVALIGLGLAILAWFMMRHLITTR